MPDAASDGQSRAAKTSGVVNTGLACFAGHAAAPSKRRDQLRIDLRQTDALAESPAARQGSKGSNVLRGGAVMSESLPARLRTGADARLARGVVAGLSAGLVFLLANMWYADSQGMPPVAPLYDISTIFHFADKPQPSPDNLAVGLVTHLTLSAAFGATFALLAPLASGSARLVAASAIFGLLLYIVNFQVLGRLIFEWFQEGPDQT